METHIYALVDCVGTIRYVGKSYKLNQRIAAHRRKRPWVSGYIVLESIPSDGDWRTAERRHIETWNQWGDLENLRNGGNAPPSGPRGPLTKGHREKISAALKGRPWDTPGRRAAMIGIPKSPEHRAKISAAMKGNRNGQRKDD